MPCGSMANMTCLTQIEKANLAELDWALAHMGGSRRKSKNVGDDWVSQAEMKGVKEKDDVVSKIFSHNKQRFTSVQGNLRGLGALLFDDAPPPSEVREKDEIQKTLNAIGVKYSHHNDQVLVPSRIEEERAKKTLENTRRRRKSKGKVSLPEEAAPAAQWPPIRRHHKPKPTPEQQ
ncbi:hypothetical protein H0H81_008443 [Sphagnurus paluster]|uniref:Helicase-associated putative binding domain-containing protein n=1 Tax=Sphagnurus paluster TaxID=117069 RepID=A0A9P7FZ12_9AGAR|nr:hypothetical protein H0H81_008443 [Sphagnurus paluster]